MEPPVTSGTQPKCVAWHKLVHGTTYAARTALAAVSAWPCMVHTGALPGGTACTARTMFCPASTPLLLNKDHAAACIGQSIARLPLPCFSAAQAFHFVCAILPVQHTSPCMCPQQATAAHMHTRSIAFYAGSGYQLQSTHASVNMLLCLPLPRSPHPPPLRAPCPRHPSAQAAWHQAVPLCNRRPGGQVGAGDGQRSPTLLQRAGGLGQLQRQGGLVPGGVE